MRFYFVFSFLLLAFCDAQSITRLKDLCGDNTVNVVRNGAGLVYFTATSDDVELLKQINFKNGDTKLTAFDLTQNRYFPNMDLLIPWAVTGITTVTTSLSKTQMQKLTGSIYITSASQAIKGKLNLYVYDITQTQKVIIDKSIGKATVVFLNSQFSTAPNLATTIFNWNQPSDTSVSIYNGIPSDSVEDGNTQIFSNPVNTGQKPVFIDSVEDFVMTLGVFYMKIEGTGGLSFITSLKYKDIDQSKTKAVTTTGFYMKSHTDTPVSKTIYPIRDTAYHGFSGANSIADISSTGSIDVDTFDDTFHSGISFSQSAKITSWNVPMIGSTLTISPNNTDNGQYFIQYYIHQENRI